MALTDHPDHIKRHTRDAEFAVDPTVDGDDLVTLSREAVRILHLVARELEDAMHDRCYHEPLTGARDASLALAVRLQMALRDLN